MYGGYGFSCKRRSGRRMWRWICILILTAEITGIFGVLAARASGAAGERPAELRIRTDKQLSWSITKSIGSTLPEKLPGELQGPRMPTIAVDSGYWGENVEDISMGGMGKGMEDISTGGAGKDVIGVSTGGTGEDVVSVSTGGAGKDVKGLSMDSVENNVGPAMGKRLKDKLTKAGYRVIMTRGEDTSDEKGKQADPYVRDAGDLHVSISQNPYGEPGAIEIKAWYKDPDKPEDSERLARLIHREVLRSTGIDSENGTGCTETPSSPWDTGFILNPGEQDLSSEGSYLDQAAEGIARGIDLYYHPKTMYLTFDDGPSAENTSAVLDILKARGVKATFFVVGENVRRNPELTKRIVREGHTIGIHCNQHQYDKIYESVDSYMRDFQAAYNAVLEVTGAKVRLYRFPGGSINAYNQNLYQDIIKEMSARGFTYFDWNASLEDSLRRTAPEELIANAKRTVLGRENVVLLAHDIVYSTAQCLDQLIDEFPEYKIRPLTPESEAVQFHP